ncbi:CLUMA_CG000755, isoform E [Clunio marinus]|uniref:CLUMA_CG000755, isoform E n=1 Tax=Clunio marinus TaxID=568069 RepID=A0A1J1HL25_9DIPT|nr:CLUMA_CG000755, isoform E [Clunio marinus]
MTMSLNEKRMLDREALRSVIQQWNANRLDLFELSEPNENLEFHGVMRFYFQDVGQKVATKCIRVASDATVADVIETLIEKFRPDMRMLSVPNYALYEVHANGEERKLNPDEKPLLVQLNWHVDDREGRFLLKDLDQKPTTLDNNTDTNFKRKLSKREKKEQKKKEKLQKLNPNGEDSENHVAEKLYTELPETSFTRSISNPEAVMRRRRQQKLEKKLQQFRARDGGPDTGGTLKIYGESLCRDVPYKTLLLSIRDCAQAVVREMLAKYGMDKADPLHYCLVQVNSDGSEYILDDDECPLSILMNHPTSRGSIMFHVRRRPAADTSQPRRRKKKPLGISNGSGNMSAEREGPVLIEITHSGDGGRRLKLTTEPVEVGSANTNALQLFGPSIQPRHCLISLHEGVCTVTPLHADGLTFVNGHHITQPTILHNGSVVMFGRAASYRFVDVPSDGRYNLALSQSQLDSAYLYENRPQSFAKPPAGMSATPTMEPQGQEAILPAVLEFPEHHQEQFLKQVISELDVNSPNFKLAPVYTLYLCARYRASTHYRPDLQPTERAHKLTVFLHHVANLIHNVIQEKYNDPKILSFWMANSSEFLHFLKSDRHISAFSVQAQEVLAECVQTAFQNLVSIFHSELSQTLNQFLSENIDHDSAAGLVLSVLGSAMALLRRCRVNAALTIQLFSQLFHYINVVCFNKFVTTSHMCTSTWGKALSDRLSLLELWAEKQGLELAADCHLAKINQCAEFLQAPKTNVTEVQQLACSCFRLNSLQMAALLSQETIPRTLIDATVRMAESVADELTRADGREIRLEESPDLPLALLLPVDGFSCDVVRGIPAGLVDFLSPYQVAGMCRLASQLTSIGLWTVYMHQFNGRSPSVMSTKMPQPEVQTIKLHKNTNGMGLSIVAAKGAGQDRLGIYIKSVVAGGAADADGRLQAGDQLLRVDGQSLIGITQERAADYLVRTGPIVTLEVAKQGAIFHGLATLLQQPSPVIQRGGRRMSERDMTRVGADVKPSPAPGPQLLNSKSVPTLHHIGNASNKSRSVHSLVGPSNSAGNINTASATDQGFYQNLSVYRQQNQSQPNLGDNRSLSHQLTPLSMQQQQQQQQISGSNTPTSTNIINRPASAFFNNSNNNNVMNQQSPSTPNIPSTQSTSTGNLMQQQPMVGFNQLPSSVIQAPHAHISHPNLSGQSNINRPPMLPNKMIPQQQQQQSGGGNGGNFMRDIQSQHSLRMTQQQMMAPSMPNIAHASGYANNISASQSMQNMNQMSAQNFHPQSPQKQLPPTAPKPQRHPMDEPSQLQIQPQPQPPLPPSSTHPLFKSPITQQPSTAQQQNSTSATLSYNVNSNDVQSKAGYYQQQPQQQSINKSATSNPWEREERERENEMRREQLRHWRDQQIVELSLLPSRSPQQEEQLKTLVLERDFERRAQEEENEEENEAQYQKNQEILRLQPGNNNNVSIPPSQTSTAATRLKQVDIKTMPTNISPSSEMIMNSNDNFQTAPPIQPKSILKSTNAYNNSNPSSPSKHAKVTSFAPKNQNLSEITMNNTNANQMLTQINKEMSEMTIEYQAEETNGPMMPPPPPERGSSFAVMQHQKVRTSNSNNSGNSANFTKLTFNDPQLMSNNISGNVNNNNNSKFVPSTNNNEHSPMVMMSPTTTTTVAGTFTAHQIQQQMNLINNNVGAFTRDNKRVSFHDHENNNNNNINNNVEIIGEQDLSMIREDPNRFIDETAAMLQSPQSPDGDTNWSIQVQSTPGVIGAQEVYRDPRQRRLAEQQQKKSEAPVPEKLTFKEKMKMFALESGENTPKDKLKISRAQRDIDAVH